MIIIYYIFKHIFSVFISEEEKAGTLDALLSNTYCRSQMYLSKQMAQLRPELTMPMFSGKFFSVQDLSKIYIYDLPRHYV